MLSGQISILFKMSSFSLLMYRPISSSYIKSLWIVRVFLLQKSSLDLMSCSFLFMSSYSPFSTILSVSFQISWFLSSSSVNADLMWRRIRPCSLACGLTMSEWGRPGFGGGIGMFLGSGYSTPILWGTCFLSSARSRFFSEGPLGS